MVNRLAPPTRRLRGLQSPDCSIRHPLVGREPPCSCSFSCSDSRTGLFHEADLLWAHNRVQDDVDREFKPCWSGSSLRYSSRKASGCGLERCVPASGIEHEHEHEHDPPWHRDVRLPTRTLVAVGRYPAAVVCAGTTSTNHFSSPGRRCNRFSKTRMAAAPSRLPVS